MTNDLRYSPAPGETGDAPLAVIGADETDRYHALFNAIDDGFCIIEFVDGPHGPLSDYVHVEANPGYERHTGIRDIVGKTLREIDPLGVDVWLKLYGDVLLTGERTRFEQYFAAVDRHIEVSAARLEPASRRQVAVLFRDISARRCAEVALRTSEGVARENVERVQLALDAGAIIGTWVWDVSADQFTIDEGFATVFGLDPALGRSGIPLDQVVESVHPDDKPGLMRAIEAALVRGGRYAHRYRVRDAAGVLRWIEANGRVDVDADGRPVRFPGVLLDIEERRAVEVERDAALAALRDLNQTLEQRIAARTADLMRAEEQLRQSQKMEALGQLTGGIAHDFNNLLAAVSGSLELIDRRLQQDRYGDIPKYLRVAETATERAATLTHRLLAFSRRQTLEPRPTDINQLITGLIELIKRTVGPEIEIRTSGPAELWATLVDPGQLENALLNLCINARDAMPAGGSIEIATANISLDAGAALARGLAAGDHIVLSVRDTGSGMPADVLDHAFDPFFTTKPLGQGTGLGLSMVYGFVTQSGGRAVIASQVGQGTTVTIHLPRHDGRVPGQAPNEVDALLAPVGAGQRILVVDDEEAVRMLIHEALAELGYRVVEAETGAAALSVLTSDPDIDLLLTDVGLPGGMNGRQLADAARVSRPDMRVLFVTGYAQNSTFGAQEFGPDMHVLRKPFLIDELVTRVADVLDA